MNNAEANPPSAAPSRPPRPCRACQDSGLVAELRLPWPAFVRLVRAELVRVEGDDFVAEILERVRQQPCLTCWERRRLAERGP